MLRTETTAAIYVPEGHTLDGQYAKEGILHIKRRGYKMSHIARNWDTVIDLIRNREVDVVVFARRSHMKPDWSPRVEYVGDETQRIITGGTKPRNDKRWGRGKHRRPRFTD